MIKERPIIDEHGYELQKKVMRRLIEKENNAKCNKGDMR